MPKKIIAIITGTSRGIGKAMMESLLHHQVPTISINRRAIDTEIPGLIGNLVFDLGQLDDLDSLADNILRLINPPEIEKILFINNAAVIGTPGKMDDLPIKTIRDTLEVNLISPVLFNTLLVQKLKDFTVEIDIAHISSGAAFHALAGLGAYCISKAGLEMLSSVLNAESEHIKSVTLGPGVVDTGMQEQLRASNPDSFPSYEKFVSFKEKGFLQSPTEVANRFIDFLLKGDFEGGKHYQVSDLS